jgi:hypothetical protein
MSQSLGNENPPFWRLTLALTIKEIENAKPKAKKYKMLDGGGLSLLVLPTGTKPWLWRYPFNGGEKNMTFGEYPIQRRSRTSLQCEEAAGCRHQSDGRTQSRGGSKAAGSQSAAA